ncbi:hypothetical protein P8452_16854 [Trifolium repens]|nr:hypothetical protein P8452_16854 [Trifolium repens]
MNSEKKWNKAWNNVCNNFSRLNEIQLRRGREQHKESRHRSLFSQMHSSSASLNSSSILSSPLIGTLKKMGKLALFFEFVLMGIWMKFVALLGNGG